ncbi:adenine deaminase [Lachnospiraceae bacterium KM106-2]|nr:adenine deaminase [Lachnospiraceae bacterium KM106-2]
MDKLKLKKLIDVAAGRVPADMVIKNAKIVDVYQGCIKEGDIAICDGAIAGIGDYEGTRILDAKGRYVAPGFIDSHIHIESSYLTPEEFGKLLVPCGATTIIADPHEIVNVCGNTGLQYMLDASENTALDIKFMIPSCVPATPFEHAGAMIDAASMESPIKDERVLGLGEFMNYPGVVNGSDDVLDKLLIAHNEGKLIDGHSPALAGKDLNAYAAARIHTDHECATVEEMNERISRGIYVLLRHGSACKDLRNLLKGVTSYNSRRCLLCSDDRQPKTIFEEGHLDNHIRICIEEGIDPIVAIQMATLNAAECFGLSDRGAIAPGLRADLVLFNNLEEISVSEVLIAGEVVAKDGEYLLPVIHHDSSMVRGSFHVKDFSKDKLRLPLKGDFAHIIDIQKDSVVTKKSIAKVKRNEHGEFVYDERLAIAKIAVVERHQNTGNVAVGLIRGYGITSGAIALSIAHDSHNIITVGVSDEEMEFAVNALLAQGGGIVAVKKGKVLESMPLPIGGIMSDKDGKWVEEKVTKIHEVSYKELGIQLSVEPIMTLCFMSLAVIPELKITDMGLFDVTKFEFLPIDAEQNELSELE